MKKKLLIILLTAITLCTACASSNQTAMYAAKSSDFFEAPAMDSTESVAINDGYAADYDSGFSYDESYEYAEEELYDSTTGSSSTVETSENASTSNRKLIKDVNINVETKDYDSLLANIDKQITELGGYVEYMDVYNGSSYNNYRSSRSANITARIPAAKLDEFLGKVGEESNITNKTESVRDITLTYVDMESHKNMLIAERDHLMELLESAETIEDMITVEDRLTEIRYQIDSMESQLRTYDNQVDYSTVNIYISEVVSYTPAPTVERTAWERISEGFVESIVDVCDGIKEFCIGFIIALPYIFVWIVGIAIVIFILRSILRMSKKYRNWSDNKREARKVKKEAKKAAKLERK